MSDDEFDDDVFDNADVVEDMLRSSQAPNTQQSLKRNLDGALERNGENSAKRVKSEPHAQPHNDTGHDVENVALARRLLKQKFGYKSFRHEQEDAIRRILTGQSALVIFPTGAGKSLCYQVSASLCSELFFSYVKSLYIEAAGPDPRDCLSGVRRNARIERARQFRHHHRHLASHCPHERSGRRPKET